MGPKLLLQTIVLSLMTKGYNLHEAQMNLLHDMNNMNVPTHSKEMSALIYSIPLKMTPL